MDANHPIIHNINAEIEKLTRARDLILGTPRHRSSNLGGIQRRRPMSPETKRKISEAMAKRWAQKRKSR
jgi:hypothetical protein